MRYISIYVYVNIYVYVYDYDYAELCEMESCGDHVVIGLVYTCRNKKVVNNQYMVTWCSCVRRK